MVGPARQPVRARRLRWWLGGDSTDREVGENDNVKETNQYILLYFICNDVTLCNCYNLNI